MILGQARGFGFSVTSALKTAAKGVYSVARDPRTQALVAAGAEAYAPGQTEQVRRALNKAQHYYSQGRAILVPAGQMPPPGAVPMPPPGPPPDDTSEMPSGPVQKSHMFEYAAIGGAALLILILLRR